MMPARAGDPGRVPPQTSRRPWQLKDSVAVGLLTSVAGLVRVLNLSRPGGFVFDEFYAADACWYVYGSRSLCLTGHEITVVHPPLGKWLMGLGIRLFGFSPSGWRIASAVAGTLTVAALYLLARKLLSSTIGAVLAAGFLAFDFLHVVLSRTAMLDVFATAFAVFAFLCLAYDREASLAGRGGGDRWGLRRPWRLAAGLAAGAAAASKWSGWPFLVAILALTVAGEIRVRRRGGQRRAAVRALREEGGSILLGLVVLPIVVYVASYAGRLEGSLLEWPWSQGAWLRAFAARQAFMLDFHLGLAGEHPYASPAWSWLLLKRPVLFYFTEVPGHRYQEILATGNPLVWWTSVVALVSLAWPWARSPGEARRFIVAGFVAGLGPWLILGGAREEVFLYLALPAVPFMCLALGAVSARVVRSRVGVGVVAALGAGTIGLFLFFYPLLTAVPLRHEPWRDRILFTDCGQEITGAPLRPRTEPGPAPGGWCWI